jgi:hypothetical protein
MLRHKALVAATSAVLFSAGFAKADTFSPILAADEAAAPPLMAALDQTPLGAPMKDAGITVGGWVQASWTYNFDTPDDQVNQLRVFDFEDQDLTLNQVVLFIERAVAYDKEKFDIGGRMEWMWGGDARLIHANGIMDGGQDDDEQFDPTQFYIDMNLPVGNGLKVRVGKYVTTLGYETINPTLNAFYSHSFLFGYAIPFTHLGVQANYQFSDSLEGYFGVVRGWEQGFEDVNDMVSFMLGGAWTIDESQKLLVNLITGPEQVDEEGNYRTVLDLVYTVALDDKMSLAFNADVGFEPEAAVGGGDAFWMGIAGYFGYVFNEYATGNVRAEWFADPDGARFGVEDLHALELTLGVSVRPIPDDTYGKGLVIRPEVRVDWASEDVFDNGNDDLQFTFGIDAIYAF